MRCPKCASSEGRVIDSRVNKDGTAIRRRRHCLSCGHRFSTTEEVLRDGLLVIKRDGRRQEFDRAKILSGIERACEKRPIDVAQIEQLVTRVTQELQQEYHDEIPSEAVGQIVMEKLQELDKVAYVRFASVYKDFRDVDDFFAELKRLKL
ncbi:MAG TPA: transcriptional regulator NrdR [Opitutales bacterium]|nr:transcriptional regulator NrdR [Opitutales bacterium]